MAHQIKQPWNIGLLVFEWENTLLQLRNWLGKNNN